MEEAIVGIIRASYFIRAPNHWQLQLITLLEQVENCNHLLIFEGVLFRRKLEPLITSAILLWFWWSFSWQLHRHGFFPFWLGRLCYFSTSLVVYPPYALRHGRLKLFSQLLGYFIFLNKLFSSVGFNSPHANLYFIQEVVPTCRNNIGNGIPAGHIRDRFLNLSM